MIPNRAHFDAWTINRKTSFFSWFRFESSVVKAAIPTKNSWPILCALNFVNWWLKKLITSFADNQIANANDAAAEAAAAAETVSGQQKPTVAKLSNDVVAAVQQLMIGDYLKSLSMQSGWITIQFTTPENQQLAIQQLATGLGELFQTNAKYQVVRNDAGTRFVLYRSPSTNL